MFIENVYKGKPDAWRYILGVFLIVLVYFMASMPFGIALMAEAGAEKVAGMSETEMLSVLDPNTTLFYMLLPFVFTFFGILVIVRFLHDQPLKFLVTSRSSFDWSRVVFSFLSSLRPRFASPRFVSSPCRLRVVFVSSSCRFSFLSSLRPRFA